MRLVGELLVVGPASLKLIDGRLEVLGAKMSPGGLVVIPAGRQVVIITDGDVELSGAGGAPRPVPERSIKVFMEALEAARGKNRLMIVGPPDAGKSTIAAYLYNKEIADLIVTTDVGQNEIYCPGFESSASPGRPFVPGSSATALRSCFVGGFSPTVSVSSYSQCFDRLTASGKRFIVDTDGWTSPEGLALKARLAQQAAADLVLAVGLKTEELRPFIDFGLDVASVEPGTVRSKTRYERRLHRDRLLARCLMGARQVRAGPDVKVITLSEQSRPVRGQLAAVSSNDQDYFAVITRYNEREQVIGLLTSYEGPVSLVKVGAVRINLEAFRGIIG